MKKKNTFPANFDYEKLLKTKVAATLPYAENARNFKTFNDLHCIVLIAFTASSAALYVKNGDAPASVNRRGTGHELDAITKNAAIAVAEYGFNDTAIIVASSNNNNLVIRNSDDDTTPAKGAVLFYGKPSGRKIHVRVICNRASNGTYEPFPIKNIDELWMLRAAVEPLFVSWGFRFNWVRFLEAIYGITIIIKNADTKGKNHDA